MPNLRAASAAPSLRLRDLLMMVLFLLGQMTLTSARFCLAQSTFGNIVGTITDAAGAAIPGATVTLINTGTAAQRVGISNASGEYSFNILDAGTYTVTVEERGFAKAEFSNMVLLARESKRVDASLKVGSDVQTVEVQGSNEGVITTETSSLASTETGEQLVDLPVAVYAHSNGSTSPITTLTETNPGVQTDDSGNLVIAGATPALLSVTIDGISSVNVEYSGPLNELFPSFNSISEIRVSEINNNAEYSGVADITTTSRAGTNEVHGGFFENHENTALNAGDPFTGSKPKIIMNDFGAFAGGPLVVPHFYSGHDKTFYFASFEGLRLPRETPLVTSVPTLAMRSGNLSSYLAGQAAQGVESGLIYNYDGTPLNPAAVPVSAVAANMMNLFMPLPNRGSADSYQDNYAINFPSPISSNQGDLRLDQNFNSKQSAFVRLTYKDRQVTTAPDPTNCYCATAGSPLQGGYSQPEIDLGLTLAHTYVLKPTLINEFRTGYNARRTDTSIALNTQSLITQTGIQGITDPDIDGEVPNASITGFMPTGGGNPEKQTSGIFQLIDNVTWTKQNHTMKFGFDFRRLTDHDDNVFGSTRSGQFNFNGSSAVGATINDAFTQFLLGYPDYTILSQVTDPNMDGLGYSYAWFAQDDWKVKPRFTLNFGLRYELHPPLKEINYDTAAFDPTYSSAGVTGAVVVPNAQAEKLTEPLFAESIAPTPILTAAQAGLPTKLRYTALGDFGPRIGFAWSPTKKIVLRGGWGNFIESPLGFSLVSGWSVSASYVPQYYNSYNANGTPALSFPSPFPSNLATPGAASFEYAFPIHYKDPSVQQWNLTYEQDLGYGIGLRLSYVGSHGKNLEEFEDLNQVQPNTAGYSVAAASRPFPDWQILQSVTNAAVSNYNSFSAVVDKRLAHGLEFNSSYVFTRDLSDEGGAVPMGLVGAGGNYLTNRFQPSLDYGDVTYDRRHRFLTSGLYNLPFGRGQMFLPDSGRVVSSLLGGWQLGGVFIWQSGPFLTPYEESDDPAGTNEINVTGYTRPDRVMGQPLYAKGNVNGDPLFLNSAAFVLPGSDIGRFGNSTVGSLVGPGTVNTSLSLLKSVTLTEKSKLELGISAANVFNHRNYEPPNTEMDTSSYGQSSALQTAEGAGPRSAQLTGRLSF
jgi:hypothetical protein